MCVWEREGEGGGGRGRREKHFLRASTCEETDKAPDLTEGPPLPYNPGVTFTSPLFLLSRDSQNQTCFVILGLFLFLFMGMWYMPVQSETLSFILFWVFETGSFYFWLFYVILFWEGLYYVVKAILKFCVDQVGLLSTEITLNLGKIFWEHCEVMVSSWELTKVVPVLIVSSKKSKPSSLSVLNHNSGGLCSNENQHPLSALVDFRVMSHILKSIQQRGLKNLWQNSKHMVASTLLSVCLHFSL